MNLKNEILSRLDNLEGIDKSEFSTREQALIALTDYIYVNENANINDLKEAFRDTLNNKDFEILTEKKEELENELLKLDKLAFDYSNGGDKSLKEKIDKTIENLKQMLRVKTQEKVFDKIQTNTSNYEKTDIELIKEKYNIKDFLDFTGIEYKEKNGDLWLKNPFLEQKTGSVIIKHINTKDGTYYSYFKDFASENKGDIANFVMFYYNLDFKSAIELLKETFNEKNFERLEQIKEENNQFIKKVQENIELEKNNSIEINKIQELKNQALIDYLRSRGIDLATAAAAGIKEIYYTNKNNGKKYFALAFENEKGGIEVRNAYFKGSFGAKDITIIKNKNSKEVNVFEGFLDYASAIKLSKNKVLNQNNIILNSVVEADKAIEAIKSLNADKVKLYLDNDRAGDKAVEEIKKALGDKIEVIDNRKFYKNFNDLNDFLNNKIQQQIKEKGVEENER